MQRWLASGLKEIEIEIWFGGNGSGWIELYELKDDQFVSLSHNPDPDSPLIFKMPPKYGVRQMSIKTIAADVGGNDLPVFIKVSQNGVVVPCDDGLGHIVNGDDPYRSLQFADLAKHNSPSYFYFNVKFS